MAYTKLFSSIITSTIWTEDDRTRIVWITMLACADKNGEVQASIPGLARIAGVPVEDCRAAIEKFLSPDRDSRTKDDEGRRIEEIDGGWTLINYRKYRDMATEEDRKNQAAVRQQRARDKASRNNHASVTPPSRKKPQAEAEAEATEREREPQAREARSPCSLEDAINYSKTIEAAPGLPWAERAVRQWWSKREASCWVKLNGAVIGRDQWRQDMFSSAKWAHEESDGPRRGKRANGKPIDRMEIVEFESLER